MARDGGDIVRSSFIDDDGGDDNDDCDDDDDHDDGDDDDVERETGRQRDLPATSGPDGYRAIPTS